MMCELETSQLQYMLVSIFGDELNLFLGKECFLISGFYCEVELKLELNMCIF